MNQYCIDCGDEYDYNSVNPLGADSLHCSKCRKKNTVRNRKILLFKIAGNGQIACRKCGYSDSVNAINLVDGITHLDKSKNKEEEERRAHKSFLLCCNCIKEIEAQEVEFKVTDSKCYPIEVEFYNRKVVVEVKRTKIDPCINYTHDATTVEVFTGGETPTRIVGTPKRIGGESTIDVS